MGEEYDLSDSAEMRVGFIVEKVKECVCLVEREHKF